MEGNIMMSTILKELREFRVENNKKWQENDKRWEENNKRWEENDKRWEENNKRWEENNKRWEENDKNLEQINTRLTRLEKARESDKKEFIRIWSTMEQAIVEKISEMERKNDIKFNKIEAILEDHKESIKEQKQKILDNTNRIELQNVRIETLEDWKNEFESGELSLV